MNGPYALPPYFTAVPQSHPVGKVCRRREAGRRPCFRLRQFSFGGKRAVLGDLLQLRLQIPHVGVIF
jgi:hypothetical protein